MSVVDDIKKAQADTKASLQGVASDLASLTAEIQTLKDGVVNGGVATAAELQSILDGAIELRDTVKVMDDAIPAGGGQPVP